MEIINTKHFTKKTENKSIVFSGHLKYEKNLFFLRDPRDED